MSSTLSIIAVVIAVSAAGYTICFGVLPLKDILVDVYRSMWWISMWGTLRYAWLKNEFKSARLMARNIDWIFLKVFNTMDLSRCHDDHHYTLILDLLQIRAGNSASKLFPLETVCAASAVLTADSDPSAWRIVYEMTKILDSTMSDPAALRSIVMNLCDKHDAATGIRQPGLCSQIFTKQPAAFQYVVAFHDEMRRLVPGNARFVGLTDFTADMKQHMLKARNTLQEMERQSYM
jgi:hypothetical protein